MLLPLVLALIPLVIAPGLLFYYDVTPKVALLLVGVAVGLPWFAPGRLMARREGRWLYLLLGAQAVSLALSTVFSTRISQSVWGTNWRRFGLITQLAMLLLTAIVAADLAGSRERLRVYLRAIVAAAIPVSLYGIVQYFGWDPWIPKQAYHAGEGIWTIVRPPGTLGYVSYFANYLAGALFFACALYGLEEGGWWKRVGAAAAVVAAVAIVLSGTRGAMLGVVAGAVYMRPRLSARAIGVAACVVAAVALFVISPAGQLLRSRFHWSMEEPLGGARVLLFRDSLALAAGHPVVGIGPEAFSAEFPRAQSEGLSEAYPDFYHESPHNILLDAVTGQGVMGGMALAGFIALGFYAARGAGRALGACLVAGVVAGQFAVFTAPTGVYFFLVVAMVVGAAEMPGSGKRPAGGPTADRGVYPTVVRSTISVVVVIFSVVVVILAVRLVVGDWKLQRVKTDLGRGDRRAATLEYSSARGWGVNADLWYSNQMAAAALKAPSVVEGLKAWQQALEAGVRATKTSDDPHNAWYSLAVLHARQNDFERTENCLREAIASSPTWFKPHWMLARILLTRGRRDEAKVEAELAARLNGGKDPEVSQTLADSAQ